MTHAVIRAVLPQLLASPVPDYLPLGESGRIFFRSRLVTLYRPRCRRREVPEPRHRAFILRAVAAVARVQARARRRVR